MNSEKRISYICLAIVVIVPLLIVKNGLNIDFMMIFNIIYVVSLGGAMYYLIKTDNTQRLINIIVIAIVSISPLIIISHGYDAFSYSKINYIYILSLLGAIIVLIKGRNLSRKNHKVDYIIFIYIILVLLSTINSNYTVQSIIGERDRYEGFAAIACYVFIYFFTSRFYKFSKRHLKYFIISACIISIYGISQYYGFDPFLPLDNMGPGVRCQAFSTFGNRNFLGSYITLILPISFFAFIYTKKYLYIIISSLLYVAMLCTYTRSSWIAFFFFLIFIAYLARKFKLSTLRYLLFIIILTIITLGFNYTEDNSILGRLTSIGKDMHSLVQLNKNSDSSGTSRIFIWKRAIRLIPSNPVLGSGPDTFGNVFMKKYKSDIINEYKKNLFVDKAHNELIQILVTIGVPALVCYLIFLFLVLYEGHSSIKDNILIIPVLCSVITYFIQSMFNISIVGIAPIYWFMIGMLVNISKKTFEFHLH